MAQTKSPPIQPNAGALPADQIDYIDLYHRWEQNNWSALDLDFSKDKVDWNEKFDDFMRKAARWNYSLFFFGEDEVTDTLSPFIDAAPLEEHKYFLATQQVDEARHAIFFSRFFREVIGVGTDDYASTLQASHGDLTWGLKKVFQTLRRVTHELHHDHSKAKLAQAVTLYHIVVEGTLAQTGQHFIADYLDEMNVLPGFREGIQNVEKDEQRHIAFGVKLLADLNRQDPEVRPAMREILGEVLPYTVAVFRPPDDDERYVSVFGKTLQEIAVTGQRQIDQRLTAAGLPIRGPEGVLPFLDDDITYEERADRSFAMMRAGLLTHGTDPLNVDSKTLGFFFDLVKSSIRPDHGFKTPKVLQWDFTDAEPWHIRIDNGNTEAFAGLAPSPDVTLTASLKDFVAVTDGRLPIGKALVQRKLKPRGKVSTLLALPRLFETP